ncbi:MAG: hypothetical protein AcusKO_10680 [Acuticoccus sp.]
MNRAIWLIALVAAVAGGAGVVIQFLIALDSRGTVLAALWRLASFYTYWVNVTVFLVMVSLVLAPGSPLTGPRVGLMITSSIVLVGLIYYGAIYNPDNDFPLRQKIAEHLLHAVVPVATLLIFLLRPHGALRWRNVLWGVVPVFIYGNYLLARGFLTDDWPYWFTDVPKLGLVGTIRNYVLLNGVFAVSTLIFIALDRAMARFQPSGR